MSSISGYESLEAVNQLSFSNPHYMGPNLKSLVDKKEDDIHSRLGKPQKMAR